MLLKSLMFSLFFASKVFAVETVDCEGVGGKEHFDVLFQQPSLFGDVFVVEDKWHRHLRFGDVCGADQSSISIKSPTNVVMEYVRHASISLAFVEQPKHVLVVGMGGGVFSNLMASHYTDVFIDAIEIDPVVANVAKQYFNVQTSERYKVFIQDAAEYIRETKQRYDIIFLDAYDSDGIPEHLTSDVFFNNVNALLKPNGVVVANFGLDSPIVYLTLASKLRKVFGATLCLHGKEESNMVVISGSAKVMEVDVIKQSKNIDSHVTLPYSLMRIARNIKHCPQL